MQIENVLAVWEYKFTSNNEKDLVLQPDRTQYNDFDLIKHFAG